MSSTPRGMNGYLSSSTSVSIPMSLLSPTPSSSYIGVGGSASSTYISNERFGGMVRRGASSIFSLSGGRSASFSKFLAAIFVVATFVFVLLQFTESFVWLRPGLSSSSAANEPDAKTLVRKLSSSMEEFQILVVADRDVFSRTKEKVKRK